MTAPNMSNARLAAVQNFAQQQGIPQPGSGAQHPQNAALGQQHMQQAHKMQADQQMRQQQEERMRIAQQNKIQQSQMAGKHPLGPGGPPNSFGIGDGFSQPGQPQTPGRFTSVPSPGQFTTVPAPGHPYTTAPAPGQFTIAQQPQQDPGYQSQVMKLALSNLMKQYQDHQLLQQQQAAQAQNMQQGPQQGFPQQPMV